SALKFWPPLTTGPSSPAAAPANASTKDPWSTSRPLCPLRLPAANPSFPTTLVGPPATPPTPPAPTAAITDPAPVPKTAPIAGAAANPVTRPTPAAKPPARDPRPIGRASPQPRQPFS